MGVYTLHSSQTETSSGVGATQLMSVHNCVGLFVNVSAVSGTLPGLVLKLQHSPDGQTWYDVPNVVSGTISTVGTFNLSPSSGQSVADYVRCVWTITGVSPNFTFDTLITIVGS